MIRALLGLAWLWAFLQVGELVGSALHLPVPGSVVGMVLLWAALETGVVRLAWLQSGASGLLRVLGLLFVPAGVGFVQFIGFRGTWAYALAVAVAGTLLTLAVTGHLVARQVGDD